MILYIDKRAVFWFSERSFVLSQDLLSPFILALFLHFWECIIVASVISHFVLQRLKSCYNMHTTNTIFYSHLYDIRLCNQLIRLDNHSNRHISSKSANLYRYDRGSKIRY